MCDIALRDSALSSNTLSSNTTSTTKKVGKISQIPKPKAKEKATGQHLQDSKPK